MNDSLGAGGEGERGVRGLELRVGALGGQRRGKWIHATRDGAVRWQITIPNSVKIKTESQSTPITHKNLNLDVLLVPEIS